LAVQFFIYSDHRLTFLIFKISFPVQLFLMTLSVFLVLEMFHIGSIFEKMKNDLVGQEKFRIKFSAKRFATICSSI